MPKKAVLLVAALVVLGCEDAFGPDVDVRRIDDGAGAVDRGPRNTGETIEFAGYRWRVAAGRSSPGPTSFERNNAWVDRDGRLHLLLTYDDGQWHGAYVALRERLGFGTYEFRVTGRLDNLDPNIVVGLFNYPSSDVGPDGTYEIDIEFAKWGKADNPNAWYVIWPTRPGGPKPYRAFRMPERLDRSTHRFTWLSNEIHFESRTGHGGGAEITSWRYRPDDPLNAIGQQPMPVHLNVWLQGGKSPTNGREVEIIIDSFTFTPAGA